MKVTLVLAMAALRKACDCRERDTPPTDWKTKAPIPHHCDCVMYALELPNEHAAPAAYADALKARIRLLGEALA